MHPREERTYCLAQYQGKAATEDMTAVGFEPTQLALVELESTPLDHSGKLSCRALVRRGQVPACTSQVAGGRLQALQGQVCVHGNGLAELLV